MNDQELRETSVEMYLNTLSHYHTVEMQVEPGTGWEASYYVTEPVEHAVNHGHGNITMVESPSVVWEEQTGDTATELVSWMLGMANREVETDCSSIYVTVGDDLMDELVMRAALETRDSAGYARVWVTINDARRVPGGETANPRWQWETSRGVYEPLRGTLLAERVTGGERGCHLFTVDARGRVIALESFAEVEASYGNR